MATNPPPPRQQRPQPQPQENVEVADMPVPRMSPSLGRFAPAFVRVQAAIQPVIKARTNPAFKGDRPVTYADLASILEEALPILAANGFGLMQFPSTENNQLALMSMLIHESGEFVSATMPLLLQKADPQGEGSAISYGRRYAACAILGIRTIDDDGNAASARDSGPAQRPSEPARRPARDQPQNEPSPPDPDDAPQPKDGWATVEAEAAAHKAAGEQIKQLLAIVGEDHPIRKELKGYRELNGWPMPANALMQLSMIVAKAHGEATAAAGQEQTTPASGSEGRPEAAAPAPEAPSAPVAPPESMPWDGVESPAPDSLSVCPWCEREVERGQPSVITGGTRADDPAVRYHKGCYDERRKEAESEG